MPAPDPAHALAELAVMTDTVERIRQRVAAVAEPFLGTDREDVVTLVHEAERQLLVSVRSLERAMKMLDR
jgi:hypothetical protein